MGESKRERSTGTNLVSWASGLFSAKRGFNGKMKRQSIEIEEDVQLSYVRSGAGQTMIFVPGWTMTSGFFQYQQEHFAKSYDVIALDPRSHGEASKTVVGNNYSQHGKDLQRFMNALDLQGCYSCRLVIRRAGYLLIY